MPPKKTRYEAWDAARVRALRKHLGFTQQQLSDELGTRQQTISEWETGMYQPRGASAKLLSLIAERAEFHYGDWPPASNGCRSPSSSPCSPAVMSPGDGRACRGS